MTSKLFRLAGKDNSVGKIDEVGNRKGLDRHRGNLDLTGETMGNCNWDMAWWEQCLLHTVPAVVCERNRREKMREERVLMGVQMWGLGQSLMCCRSRFWTGWEVHMNWKMEELMNEQDWCNKVPGGPYSSDTLYSCYLLCSIFWYSTLIRNPLQTAWVLVIIWANFSSLISSRRPSRPALKKTWREGKSQIIPRLQERQTRQMVLGSAVSK